VYVFSSENTIANTNTNSATNHTHFRLIDATIIPNEKQQED